MPFGNNLVNKNITLLASAARTATTNSDAQVNLCGRGVMVTVTVTAVTSTPSITPKIQAIMGGNNEDLLSAAAAITGTGVHTYIVYPGVGAASGDVVQVAGFPLPRDWRVSVVHGDTDSITYSVTACAIL